MELLFSEVLELHKRDDLVRFASQGQILGVRGFSLWHVLLAHFNSLLELLFVSVFTKTLKSIVLHHTMSVAFENGCHTSDDSRAPVASALVATSASCAALSLSSATLSSRQCCSWFRTATLGSGVA